MAHPPTRTRPIAAHCPCKQWLEFLTNANTNPKNTENLHTFFLHEFVREPQSYVHCLSLIKAELKRPGDHATRAHIATQFLAILSPLCEQFGLFAQKNELDALSFRILEPEHFRSVTRLLAAHRRQSRMIIPHVTETLHRVLQKTHYRSVIRGRFKSAVSIYRKIKEKGYGHPLDMQDIFAFRIILKTDSISACFDVLHLLHDFAQPLPGRFKDYITIPKINGYQSLHTVLTRVIPTLQIPIEVQIRTSKMHEFAERGLASHWFYKRSPHHHAISEKERKLLQNFHMLAEEAKRDKTVMCLSPTGDVIPLPHGATIVDFAYRIHTKLGDTAAGANVNGNRQPLRYEIQSGDRIEVIRSVERAVKREWLQFALTPSARRTIYEHTRS